MSVGGANAGTRVKVPALKKDQRYKNPIAKGKFRNGVCMCGSGKKIKHCHGKSSFITKKELEEIQEVRRSAVLRFNKVLEEQEVR